MAKEKTLLKILEKGGCLPGFCTIHSLFRLQGPHFLRPAGAQPTVILGSSPDRLTYWEGRGHQGASNSELGLETKGQRLKGPSVAVNSPKCVNRRETAQSSSYNLCPSHMMAVFITCSCSHLGQPAVCCLPQSPDYFL